MKYDVFTSAYLSCALWASTDENGEQLDVYDASDIAPETLAQMVADCESFQDANAEDLAQCDADRAGSDFWLSRNGHGAGFFDGPYPGDMGDRLQRAAKVYGSVDLYDVDGVIHAS